MKRPIVIAGAGQAGLKVAETLRARGVDEPIVMIGDEPHLPYQRPPLSKKFLLGETGRDGLALSPSVFFDRAGIDVRLGQRVAGIARDRDEVVLEDGARVGFSKLVLATGSAPRRLTVPGSDTDAIHMIRTLDDAERLMETLGSSERVAVIGGGYVGLETAASLRSIGKDVTVFEMQDRLLVRALCPDIAAHLHDLHEARGVSFVYGVALREMESTGGGHVLHLSSGARLEADLVIAAIGGVANDKLAADAGIACSNGIRVDAQGMTSRPNVFAAGDCASFWSGRYGTWLRLESVQNANDQARAVADGLSGKAVAYDPVPWFWSDQYDTKLQMAGLCAGYDEVRWEGRREDGVFALSYWRDGRMLAVSAVNHPRAFMTGRRTLERSVAAEAVASA